MIERYKRSDVLIYADPPYILETRTKRHYKHDMNTEDHIQLLDQLNEHPGPVLLSGYDHELYSDKLIGWNKEVIDVLAEAGAKRKEVLWINPVAAKHGYFQESLFHELEVGK